MADVVTVREAVERSRADGMPISEYEDMTLQDIGQIIGKSVGRVQRMESLALQQLRRSRNASRLISFMDFDFYAGTGLGAFQNSGMSIQERYLMKQERLRELERKRWERLAREMDESSFSCFAILSAYRQKS